MNKAPPGNGGAFLCYNVSSLQENCQFHCRLPILIKGADQNGFFDRR